MPGRLLEKTQCVYDNPGSFVHLMNRAIDLWRLGFADLAAGDSYKALQLLGSNLRAVFGTSSSNYEDLSGLPVDMKTIVRPATNLHRNFCRQLAMMLLHLLNTTAAQALIQEARVNYPSDLGLEDLEKGLATRLQVNEKSMYPMQATKNPSVIGLDTNLGVVYHVAYPFIPKIFLSRSKELLKATKKEIETEAKKMFSSCPLGSSTVQDPTCSTSSGTLTALGIFATRDIAEGQVFFTDTTVLAATEKYGHTYDAAEICDNCYGSIPLSSLQKRAASCCSVFYCSQRCKDLAWENYHQVLCKQDFRWVWDDSKIGDSRRHLDGPMWLRIFAVCVQSKIHPLEYPLIARLTPMYDDSVERKWSLANNVIMPNKILQQLGIDIYADPRFDTWVLQTLWARSVTNDIEHGISGVSEI